MKNTALLILVIISFASCQENEVPTPTSAQYISWTVGDWWVYEWATYYYNTGDTIIRSLDTTYALADTMINGETYRTLSHGIYPWHSEKLHVRDSSGYIVDVNGRLVYSYVNFTDTFENYLAPTGGWFTQMFVDTVPTSVPAGTFSTINYRTTARHFTVACGDSIFYSDRQFAEDVGMVRMSYHYSAPGPCIDNVRILTDYHIQ